MRARVYISVCVCVHVCVYITFQDLLHANFVFSGKLLIYLII